MNNLEDKTLVYAGYVTPSLLGEVIFRISLSYNPKELTLVKDDPTQQNYPVHCSIYIQKKEYELKKGTFLGH